MRRHTDVPGDVARIRQNRQQRVRELHACEAVNNKHNAPVATVWLSVVPRGTIRTTALNVELHQVPAILEAMEHLRQDLERFVESNRTSAKILPFKLA